MLTRRGLLRGLAQIAVLGPLAFRGSLPSPEKQRVPKTLEIQGWTKAQGPAHSGVTFHFGEDGELYGMEFHRPLQSGDYTVDRVSGLVTWHPE